MAPRNQFPLRSAGSSPVHYFSITPSDDDDLEQIPQAIWVGVAGDIALLGHDGNSEVFPNVPVGYFIAAPVRVLDTGTTASGLVGAV